jgi:hypothetical protein
MSIITLMEFISWITQVFIRWIESSLKLRIFSRGKNLINKNQYLDTIRYLEVLVKDFSKIWKKNKTIWITKFLLIEFNIFDNLCLYFELSFKTRYTLFVCPINWVNFKDFSIYFLNPTDFFISGNFWIYCTSFTYNYRTFSYQVQSQT